MGQPTEEAFPRVLEKVLVGQSVSYPGTLFYKIELFSLQSSTVHCKKKETVSALLRDIALHMADDSLSSERNIFTATHSVFLHQIDRGALPSTRRGFFPA